MFANGKIFINLFFVKFSKNFKGKSLLDRFEKVKKELAKVIIGQADMIDALLVGLLSDGHILLEGVPGLAKTTSVNTLSRVLDLEFKRVQFTPDLLPSDIVGMEIYSPKTSEFSIKHGPVFANLLLCDEINRAPAKVQSALLEAMQEKQVTIGEQSFSLPKPFLVLATQNPIESEGAYHLPEAQLDRFMLKVLLNYNTKEEELLIAQRVSTGLFEQVQKIMGVDELQKAKEQVKAIHVDEEVQRYMIDLIDATRNPQDYELESLNELIRVGASTRGSIDLFKAVKAHAYLRGFDHVTPVDVGSMIKPVLRHRIILSYEAEASEISADVIIEKILKSIALP